ncbi:hypothetical protein [uncultured Tateyamaria sp.]|uniref:hypothetical protein n=1 Tax=uncultured Tateyamaria sp. TaxID=455651 RepID=UPI002634C245|nr:hypothetical protein [uncultured Tateyamaria sp.]
MTHIANDRTRFEFASDPAHGWLIVSFGELMAAGLSEADMTPNSYRHPEGELIALEEDCDARTFLSVWEKRLNRPVEFVDTSIYLNIRAWCHLALNCKIAAVFEGLSS